MIQQKINASRDLYWSPLYKITTYKDHEYPLEDMPPIKRSWNQDLVQEYLDMLREEVNSRDMVHTAIYNLDRMLDYSLQIIMKDTAKFVNSIRLLEFVDLPFETQSA